MSTMEFALAVILFAFTLFGCLVGAFCLGLTIQQRSTPEVIEEKPIIVEHGYLEPTTVPITIVPAVSESTEAMMLRIDQLSAEVARQSRLRKRYLRLLRAERDMTRNNHFTRHEQYLTPYWHGWVRRRALIVDRLWAEALQGSEGIANMR